VYTVETDSSAQEQVDALPAEALAAYAELWVILETAPWSGRPYRRENPEGALRALTFGGRGLVVYLISTTSVESTFCSCSGSGESMAFPGRGLSCGLSSGAYGVATGVAGVAVFAGQYVCERP